MNYTSEKAGLLQTNENAIDLNTYIQELRQGITMLQIQIQYQNRRAREAMFNVFTYAEIGNISRAIVEQTMKNFGVKVPKESDSILVLDSFQKIKFFQEKLKARKSKNHSTSIIQEKEFNDLAEPKKKRKMEQSLSNGRSIEFTYNRKMKQNEYSYQR